MDVKAFTIDSKQEVGGVWITLEEGLEVKIARMNNPVHTQCLETLSWKKKNTLRKGGMESAKGIARKAIAKCILLGWKDLQEGGENVPYSEDNALDMLTRYNWLYMSVVAEAQDPDNFDETDDEETEGNSESA